MTVNDSRSVSEVKEAIKRFVSHSIKIPDLNDDDDLFESGLVNSLFAIQLMTFIEKTFKIEIEANDLNIQNFKSMNATTSFVLKKSATRTV